MNPTEVDFYSEAEFLAWQIAEPFLASRATSTPKDAGDLILSLAERIKADRARFAFLKDLAAEALKPRVYEITVEIPFSWR